MRRRSSPEKVAETREQVLEMWAMGMRGSMIGAQLNITPAYVSQMVTRARASGDMRAAVHGSSVDYVRVGGLDPRTVEGLVKRARAWSCNTATVIRVLLNIVYIEDIEAAVIDGLPGPPKYRRPAWAGIPEALVDCAARGLTQAETARACNVTKQYVSEVAKRHNVTFQAKRAGAANGCLEAAVFDDGSAP